MKTEKNGEARKGKLGTLLGHSVVSVIRKMGLEGIEFPVARDMLAAAGVKAAENTIRIQLRAGRKKLAPAAPVDLKKLGSAPKKKAKAKGKSAKSK